RRLRPFAAAARRSAVLAGACRDRRGAAYAAPCQRPSHGNGMRTPGRRGGAYRRKRRALAHRSAARGEMNGDKERGRGPVPGVSAAQIRYRTWISRVYGFAALCIAALAVAE